MLCAPRSFSESRRGCGAGCPCQSLMPLQHQVDEIIHLALSLSSSLLPIPVPWALRNCQEKFETVAERATYHLKRSGGWAKVYS